MYSRTLVVFAGLMCAGEVLSAVIIWRENYVDAQPVFALAFAALFLTALVLLRSGRTAAGACLLGLLSLFEVLSFPGWTRKGALDWGYQVSFVAIALVSLVAVITLLVNRQRASTSTNR